MKLYYATGTCSLSPHIVLEELGISYDVERVDLRTKKTETGADYNTVTEKSAVPLLVLDNGEELSEGVAIVQYLADLKPEKNLAPENGSFERVRLQEMLNYIATELHKSHFPLFRPECGAQAAEVYTAKIKKAYDFLSSKLENKQFLFGDTFTVADAYAFTVINWHKMVKIDLAPWPVLVAYQERVASRPAVQSVLQKEGLLDKKAA